LYARGEFAAWAAGRKSLRMEFFYREMRRKTGLLMDGEEPEGGRWNFDAENRKPAKADLFIPKPLRFAPDATTQDVLDLVGKRFDTHFGDLEPFWFGVTRADAEKQLRHFLRTGLALFGDYQDAMLLSEPFLYHSILSLYINAGLLDPLDVCRRVEKEYRAGRVPLNAAEGFIRQIIGWREYVRGIYWLKMPEYVEQNFLNATRPIPDFYWTGETDMACLKAAIGQTKTEAYAHHIQRLMVTGIEPKQVHEWYLAVYADAYEWVELPNTLGMSQFADGGLLGSKPYAASGNYINRMSDYCGSCRYDVKKRTGAGACPFNALYWDFLDRNSGKLAGNPRMTQMYATWRKFSAADQDAVRRDAKAFLDGLIPWQGTE
jgi:deoxyribodipyrimidine photolyase-related protein